MDKLYSIYNKDIYCIINSWIKRRLVNNPRNYVIIWIIVELKIIIDGPSDKKFRNHSNLKL